ncbi:DUF6691 family protein [Nitrospirillum iridis]|uniref:Transporter n=1 Tax=Nitrospirillum iridis TaxID=765888 RepID=A0A7X0AXV3_9PROT|nr:DUF6691 family protein [Nitrospirillum iridis]MBB6251762.1 hypothetical protein [Nitrospirillum iridis]
MKRFVFALGAGLLFGLGLTMSAMISPAKVLGFLDVAKIRAGTWDPSLALVMATAIPTAWLGVALAGRRARPLADDAFHGPTARRVDRRLLAGAALFGIGWGLVGYCPGPALAVLALGLVDPDGRVETWMFVAAMAAGMAGFSLWNRLPTRPRN